VTLFIGFSPSGFWNLLVDENRNNNAAAAAARHAAVDEGYYAERSLDRRR
jgi:hypothetical protein